MIEQAAPFAATLVLATCIAIAAIALLRPLVQRGFGAVAVLRLWWILPTVLAAVLLPKEVVHEVVFAPMPSGAAARIDALAPPRGISWMPVFATLWLAGSLAMAAWYCWLQRRYTRLIAWHGTHGSLPPLHAPAVVGVVRPRLVLPRDFDAQFDASERRLVLLHERVHMRRRDGAANLLMALLVVLQWFNPLAHWAARAMRRDQESACDAIVIARHPLAVESYASALLKALPQSHAVPLACTWHRTHPLVERIRMLKTHRDLQPRSRLAAAFIVASAAVVSALAYAAKPETPVVVLTQATPEPAPRAAIPVNPAPGSIAPAAPETPAPKAKAPVAPRAPKAVAATPAPPAAAPAAPAPVPSVTPPPSAPKAPAPLAQAPASFSSATLAITSLRLVDDKVMVEMLIEDPQTHRVLARPRLLVALGRNFAISMGSNSDLLDASGTVHKELGSDGREVLRYRLEATPKSSNYFIHNGLWPLEAERAGS